MVEPLLPKANKLFLQGNYTEAISLYRQAIKSLPSMGEYIELNIEIADTRNNGKKESSVRVAGFYLHYLIDIYDTLFIDIGLTPFLRRCFLMNMGSNHDAILGNVLKEFDISKNGLGKKIQALKVRYDRLRIVADITGDIGYIDFVLVHIKEYIQIYRSAYFNKKFYAKLIECNEIDPVFHYLKYGCKEGRAASAAFETRIYTAKYNDVSDIGVNGLTHFLSDGIFEGRDVDGYLSTKTLRTIEARFLQKNSPRDERVDIIIPVYNGFKYLHRLIDSIVNHTLPPFRLLIGEDCSPDFRVKNYLKGLSLPCDIEYKVIFNKVNKGFIKTVNLLAAETRGNFVILNSDTIVTEGWLDKLLAPIEDDPSIASVTPFTNAGTICSFPKFMEDSLLPSDIDLQEYASTFSRFDYQVDVPTGVGFCMAINYQVYRLIGLFDEIYGLGYGEENDWCQRAAALGFRNIVETSCFVFHDHGGSFSSEKKSAALTKNIKILEKKYPDYMKDVEGFVRADPLKMLRLLASLKIKSKKESLILIIEHSFGGGTNLYTERFLKEHSICFVVRPAVNNTLFVSSVFVSGAPYGLNIYSESIFDLLESIKNHIGFDKLIINSLAGLHGTDRVVEDICRFKNIYQVCMTYLYHDYFALCPSYTLLNYKDAFCDVPAVGDCSKCFSLNEHVSHGLDLVGMNKKINSIVEWRGLFSIIMRHSDDVVFFSKSSLDIARKVYNLPAARVIPHKVDYVTECYPSVSGEVINVGVFGNITNAKGRSILMDLLSFIDEQDAPIIIHIFGKVIPDLIGFDGLFINHGPYNHADFSAIIEQYKILGVIVPSIWPETFSYVAEEAILSGVVVSCFDIGAPAERIVNYQWGVVWKIDAPINVWLTNFIDKINLYREFRLKDEEPVKIYQIYYALDQRNAISEYAIPYFNGSSNIDFNIHENEVFIREKNNVSEQQIVGYISWKFEKKSGLPLSFIKDMISANLGYDVFYVNPFFELPELYVNVWEQAEKYHPGLTALATKLYSASGYDWDLHLPMSEEDTLYCNYLFGNKRFWIYYGNILEKLIQTVSAMPSADARQFYSSVGYHTGANALTFILERTFSAAKVNNMFSEFNVYPILYSKNMRASAIRRYRELSND